MKNMKKKISFYPKANNFKLTAHTGFTLVEMLIAMSIFSVISVAAFGTFMSALRAQVVITAEKEAAENIRFAFEFMSRQIRFAQRYDAKAGQPVGCVDLGVSFFSASSQEIQFINVNDNCIKFSLVSNTILYWSDVLAGSSSSTNLTSLTSAKVDALDFIITGELRFDSNQPRVTLVARVSGGGSGIHTQGVRVNMQTTVSQRALDVP